MLSIIHKYNLRPKGIIHIGIDTSETANYRGIYQRLGLSEKNILWINTNPERTFEGVLNYDNKKSIVSMLEEYRANMNNYNFLVVNVQDNKVYQIIQEISSLLVNFTEMYVHIYTKNVFKDNELFKNVVRILNENNFSLMHTTTSPHYECFFMKDRIVYNCSISGLGDRTLDIIGASVYCELTGIKLVVNFQNVPCPENRSYNCSNIVFSDLCDVKMTGQLGTHELRARMSGYNINPLSVAKHTGADISRVVSLYKKNAKKLRLIDSLNSKIPNIPPGCHGIHLRATDKINNFGDPRWECHIHEYHIIMRQLDVYLDKLDPKTPLYFTSDDPDLYNFYYNRHRDRVVATQSGNPYIDLFTLSKCATIIQATKQSTYSIVAALIGGSKLINFYESLPNNRIFNIHKFISLFDPSNKGFLIEPNDTFDVVPLLA